MMMMMMESGMLSGSVLQQMAVGRQQVVRVCRDPAVGPHPGVASSREPCGGHVINAVSAGETSDQQRRDDAQGTVDCQHYIYRQRRGADPGDRRH